MGPLKWTAMAVTETRRSPPSDSSGVHLNWCGPRSNSGGGPKPENPGSEASIVEDREQERECAERQREAAEVSCNFAPAAIVPGEILGSPDEGHADQTAPWLGGRGPEAVFQRCRFASQSPVHMKSTPPSL